MANLSPDDLDHILTHTAGLWEPLRGKRIFITGGTGFFGRWLLESFAYANEKLALNAKALVLTRDQDEAQCRLGTFAMNAAIKFHQGDVRNFNFPAKTFAYIIHAATESSTDLNAKNPLLMLDTIVEGTRHVLDFAAHIGVKRILLTSSGAVYGTQPPGLPHMPEEYAGAPAPGDTNSAYSQGKRIAEHLCAQYAKAHEIVPMIARGFAFVGPHLPLDAHFAIGNFIRDGLRGEPIVVAGDGTPYRSYLYAADLAIWLWTILLRGTSCRPYNVGAEEAISIADLAHLVADIFATIDGTRPAVEIRSTPQPESPAARFVPSTRRAFTELDLQPRIKLRDAITRTILWNQALQSDSTGDIKPQMNADERG